MDIEAVARQLLDRAADAGQAVVRVDDDTPVAALRSAVRSGARERGLAIRTGLVEDVLAVVPADAPLWDEPAAVMRAALTAPDEPEIVQVDPVLVHQAVVHAGRLAHVRGSVRPCPSPSTSGRCASGSGAARSCSPA